MKEYLACNASGVCILNRPVLKNKGKDNLIRRDFDMIVRHQKAFSALALFLTFAVAHVYVMAAPANAAMLSGRLATQSGGLVKLNGNNVASGTTVLSGAQVQTTEGVGTTVQLGALGHVEVAPGSNLTLSFSKSSVDVNLVSGYAVLTTMKGINGTMTAPNGVSKSDPETVSTLVGADTAQGGQGGGNGGGTGEGMLHGLSNAAARTFGLTVLGIAIALTMIITHGHGRGINPSPGKP